MPSVLDEPAAASPYRADERPRSGKDQAVENSVPLPAGKDLRLAIDRHDIRRQSFSQAGGASQGLRASETGGIEKRSPRGGAVCARRDIARLVCEALAIFQ